MTSILFPSPHQVSSKSAVPEQMRRITGKHDILAFIDRVSIPSARKEEKVRIGLLEKYQKGAEERENVRQVEIVHGDVSASTVGGTVDLRHNGLRPRAGDTNDAKQREKNKQTNEILQISLFQINQTKSTSPFSQNISLLPDEFMYFCYHSTKVSNQYDITSYGLYFQTK